MMYPKLQNHTYMRHINEIIIHCSATPEDKDITADTIRRWHKAQGWRDIGYHYVVLLNGTIEQGRPLEEAGAHCQGHNSNSIGICYVGGLAKDGKTPKDTRTTEQKKALTTLLTMLEQQYPRTSIIGHNTYANKACPCFDANKEYLCLWQERPPGRQQL